MNRTETLRDRIRHAADDAAKLSMRLAALAKHDLQASPDAEQWLRYIESNLATAFNDHARWLERDSKTARPLPPMEAA